MLLFKKEVGHLFRNTQDAAHVLVLGAWSEGAWDVSVSEVRGAHRCVPGVRRTHKAESASACSGGVCVLDDRNVIMTVVRGAKRQKGGQVAQVWVCGTGTTRGGQKIERRRKERGRNSKSSQADPYRSRPRGTGSASALRRRPRAAPTTRRVECTELPTGSRLRHCAASSYRDKTAATRSVVSRAVVEAEARGPGPNGLDYISVPDECTDCLRGETE